MRADLIEEWFRQVVPAEWFTAPLVVRADRDEIVAVGSLAPGSDPGAFREATRLQRMQLAAEAESRFQRKVSWGVTSGDDTLLFTHLNVPVMTRLRLDERVVLDALITGGIARSRSEALSWCVALVGRHQHDWLAELVSAAEAVRRVRERGPEA